MRLARLLPVVVLGLALAPMLLALTAATPAAPPVIAAGQPTLISAPPPPEHALATANAPATDESPPLAIDEPEPLLLTPADLAAALAPIAPTDPDTPTADVATPPPTVQVLAAGSAGAPTAVAGAAVAVGDALLETDASGLATLPSDIPPGETIRVVAPGFWPVTVDAAAGATIELRPFIARAVYLPYERLWRPDGMAYVRGLIQDGLINAVVVDIKEEGGATLPLVATDAVRAIGAVVDPGADVRAFLAELEDLGIYRIARLVTFLDRRYAVAHPEDGLRTAGGALLDDGSYAWADGRTTGAQAYNLGIALAASPYFEEIQFDYVRFPGNSRVAFSEPWTEDARRGAIRGFAELTTDALHRTGTAVSFATFGETTTIEVEDGIGQLIEDLAPYIDYLAPMVYPSTWPAGALGFAYPPANPGGVVGRSVGRAVERLAPFGGAVVRPWLQAFNDYGPRALPYGTTEVWAQIEAAMLAGAAGFMLWDPSLFYETGALRLAAPDS